MSLSKNFPTVRPTLLLDFANAQTLDPRITFTRASPAVYYNGDTYAKAEENLYYDSTNILNSTYWSFANVTRTGGQSAPDATTTAFSIIETAISGEKTIFVTPAGTISVSANTDYTTSVFFRPNGRNFAAIRIWQATGQNYTRVFNISTGALGNQNTNGTIVTGINSTITAVTGGWYRCTVTWRVNTATVMYPSFNISDSATPTFDINGGPTYLGDGVSGIFLWGPQTEQRTSATAYTATTTAPIVNYVPQLLTAPANTARFDFNPVSQVSLGLLVEEARTNLITDSETLGTQVQATGFSNIAIAPNGTQTADLLVANTANSEHYSDKSVPVNAAVTYSYTVYAKTYAGARLCMRTATTGTAYAFYNLETGVITSELGAQLVSAEMTAVGNGWWRCRLTFTASSTGTAVIRCQTAGPTDTFVYTGDNWAGIYLWGWQVEVGGFATSYIATSGGTAARSADTPVMTGTNFSSWYNNAEGTLFAQASSFTTNSISGNPVGIASLGATSNNRVQVRFITNMTAFGGRMVASGASILTGGSGTTTRNVQYKQAVAYQSGNTVAYGSGALLESNTSPFTLVNVSSIDIGFGNTSDPLNGHIQKIAYYDQRLTNTQLQALTQS